MPSPYRPLAGARGEMTETRGSEPPKPNPKRHTLRLDLTQLAKSYGLEPPYDFYLERGLVEGDFIVLVGDRK